MTPPDRPSDDGPAETREASTDGEQSRSQSRGRRGPLDEPSAGTIGDLERRNYLKALGASAAGAAGLVGPSAGTAGAQSDWELAADQRIQENRTADLEVQVVDSSGSGVSDVQVDVEMQDHDFTFGCMVHAEFLTQGTEWGKEFEDANGNVYGEEDRQQYAETLEELFNGIVLENYHKWGIWENDEDVQNSPGGDAPDLAVEWAKDGERDMHVRGHVCLWGNVDAWAIPPDVVKAMDVYWGDHDFYDQNMDVTPDPSVWPDDEDPENPQPTANHDPEHVIQRSMDHIERIIDHYGEDVDEWEVVNEVLHEQQMIRAAEGNGPDDSSVDPLTADILGDWYEHAEQLAEQYDAGIAVNDYNVLVGTGQSYAAEREEYRTQIEYLLDDRGVDLDGIGFQCHFSDFETVSPDKLWTRLDEYGQYGVGLRATEYDTFGGSWTEQEQADYLHQFLKVWYSHPDTEDFLMWGHWDPVHWGPEVGEEQDAPLFRSDWTPKPAYDVWNELVWNEWWTEESGTTGADGTYTATAYLGRHEITVTTEDGSTVTETVEVTEPEPTTVEVPIDGGGGACEDVPTDTVEGQTVCDLDGDGTFRDVTGDGEVGQDDVVHFFEHQHRDAWKREDLFDFSDSDSVGHGDVVALFETVSL